MDALLDSIRIAVSDGASDDERRRGVIACRAVIDALDGTLAFDAAPVIDAVPATAVIVASDDPVTADVMALAPIRTPITVSLPAHPFAAQLPANPFAGLTVDQILELTIARLRAAAGAGAPAASDVTPVASFAQPFRLTLVPIPRLS